MLVVVIFFKSPATGTNPLINCAWLGRTIGLLDGLFNNVVFVMGLVEGCALKSDGRIVGNLLGTIIEGKSMLYVGKGLILKPKMDIGVVPVTSCDTAGEDSNDGDGDGT